MAKRLAVGAAVVVVLAIVVAGLLWWRSMPDGELDRAASLAPTDAERLTWTDWSGIREEVGSDVGSDASAADLRRFLDQAFEEDLSSTSALVTSAETLQAEFGFSPATLEWELFSQSARGAALLLRLPESADLEELRDGFEDLGYERPEDDDGVWRGGADLLPTISPELTPELQFLAVSDDDRLVLASDTADYLADVVEGLGDGAPDELDVVLEAAGEAPLTAVAYDGPYTCAELAMSQADAPDRRQAEALLSKAGEVSPVTGFLLAEQAGGDLRLAMGFETEDQARANADARAALLAGPAPGQGGDFGDRFEVGDVVAEGTIVRADLAPVEGEYVLSDLSAGPVLFATC